MTARPIRSEAAAATLLAASLPSIGASFHKPAPVRARRKPASTGARILAALAMLCTLAACGGGDIPADDIATIPAAPASAASF